MTPACAGTTLCGHSEPWSETDDPRVCGDDLANTSTSLVWEG